MASVWHSPASSFLLTPSPNLNTRPRPFSTNFTNPKCFTSFNLSKRSPKIHATDSPSSMTLADEESMNIDNLHRFVGLNLGRWNGTFYQFDTHGNLMHKVSTKLSASSYGEDDLMSLIQTLYIRQPPSSTSVSGDKDELEWAEYKIKETNMFTVEKYQQIAFFPNERAFSLRYETAGMLETVLRTGILGEDDIGEELPKNLKLPSRRPSLVCENCLYSQHTDRRARAFHIMDPKGIIEMLLVFLEERSEGVLLSPSLDDKENPNRTIPFLGKWKGHSLTKRSGVYGSTIAEADTTAILEMGDNGHLMQEITSTSNEGKVTTNIHWIGTMTDNMVSFDGGYQITFLPSGMYMGWPSDLAKILTESKPFHLEFCWLETPEKRQRLVRTYDVEGLVVSTTYFSESKL